MKPDRVGSWRELSHHRRIAVILAGGVLVGAINIYLTASLLPTAVADIGGEPLYAWNTTVYLCGQVIATMLVGQLLSRRSAVSCYLIGFGVFAFGSVVCAASPSMAVLLMGRGTQGLAAGLLIGLGFGLIHSALPHHLWVRGSALVSAMFGLGNLVGPAVGGLFAQFGSWRSAYGTLAVAALMMAMLVPRAFRSNHRDKPPPTGIPVRSLVLIIGAVGLLSIAGVARGVLAMIGCITVALFLAAALPWAERRAHTPILPASTYRAGSAVPWVYLTILFLASGVAVETFVPLFGQRLAALPPVTAGFLAAVLSLGWSATQVASSSAGSRQTVRRLQVAGPMMLTAAFAVLIPLQVSPAPLMMVIAWVIALLIGGAGIGLAMPHLSVAAMTGDDDPAEGNRAGAAIAIVLTMSTAFGSALAGLLVNLAGTDLLSAARYLLSGFTAVAALGVLTAVRALSADSE
ncbi:MFS transporter [Mycobacterium sp. 21AC1]|uniref:MFS transporter n=1 Tax=[Mycobacterium] appelbergii TaxID=2939269 RepID=UPI0029391855|nr:MFS transporter [Mycobacterium sp. 21AC1]MDV3129770.1 MFS transporter [Mycobacterium sp. 21AC1]